MAYALGQDIAAPAFLPFLEAVCWQIDDVRRLAPEEMLRRYERGWTYHNVLADLGKEEAEYLHELANQFGSWLVTRV